MGEIVNIKWNKNTQHMLILKKIIVFTFKKTFTAWIQKQLQLLSC